MSIKLDDNLHIALIVKLLIFIKLRPNCSIFNVYPSF